MSMGYGAVAKKYSENNETIIYEYYAFNLNYDKYYNPEKEFDGLIELEKDCLPFSFKYTKKKRGKNGRKQKVQKQILRKVDINNLFTEGKIKIEHSKYCFAYYNDLGAMAYS